MNIVRWIGRKKVLISVVLLVLSAMGIQYALTPQRISVHADRRWSSTVQKALKKKIKAQALRTIGAERLRDKLAEEYPYLKDITIGYSSSLEAQVHLSGWHPRVAICSSLPGHKVYVLCDNGSILEKLYFAVEALQGIPSIVIEGADFEEQRKQPLFIEFGLQLSSKLLDRYDITWQSKTSIILEDKQRPIIITADYGSVHDEERYKHVQDIFTDERKYHRGMKADIRLKDSLVCAPTRII